MIGIPGPEIPERTLPMRDLALNAASVAGPDNDAVWLRFGIDLRPATSQAFGPEMLDPMQIGLVSNHGGQELCHPKRRPRDRRQTTPLIQISSKINHLHGSDQP